MLPIAVTASPRTITQAILGLGACWLLAQTSVAGVVLLALAVVTMSVGLAHVATHELAVHDGDVVSLRDGERGRVRAVRWWYTVVDTVDGTTVLVPNNRISACRSEAKRSA